MTGKEHRADTARGVIVLRCLADFFAARSGLPALVGFHVTWSHAEQVWGVDAQLDTGAGLPEVERWALALDDAVVTSRDVDGPYKAYTVHEATGTAHGHPVTVWTHDRHGDGR
ncbi:hypothetical protein ACU686_29785 [Yinghuangia aomiensis]